MTNVEVLEKWYDRVWKHSDLSCIDEIFNPKTRARGLGSQTLVGPEDFKVFHGMMYDLLDNIEIGIDHSIEKDEWISALCTLTALCKKTKKPILITGTLYCKIENDEIVEGYNHFDFMGLYEQLGLLPNGAFDTGLSGQKVNW